MKADFRRVATGQEKLGYIQWLSAERCVAVGNGRNDAQMLSAAALGIAVIGAGGAHAAAVAAADVVTRSVQEALALLPDPQALNSDIAAMKAREIACFDMAGRAGPTTL
jgi:soluble P-type ATPase